MSAAGMRRLVVRDRRDDRGVSLVEVIISMLLLSIVLSMSVATFVRTNRSVQKSEDEADGLGDIRTVTERLNRDVLTARSVDPASTGSVLTLWIDSDSDYVQTDDETVTWALVRSATDPDHFDVVRSTADGVSSVIGRTVVEQFAFTYNTGAPSPSTRTVSIEMFYDSDVDRDAGRRRVNFIARLRNVE